MSVKDTASQYFLDLLAFMLIFFAEITVALVAVGFLIFADTFTGIWAAKTHKEPVTSRKAGRIVSKLILYPLAIIVAKIAETYLSPLIPWTEVTTGIIATVEIKSIFENSGKILGYNLWDRFKKRLWKDKVEELDKELSDNKKEMKVDFSKILENKVAKLTLLVSLITSLQFLIPWLQNFIVGDHIESNNEEVYAYVDKQNEIQDSINFEWTLYLFDEIIRIDERYSDDSLKMVEKNKYFAVGLRADRETATLHYRNRYGELEPVRGNDTLRRYEFKQESDGTWHLCYYEE